MVSSGSENLPSAHENPTVRPPRAALRNRLLYKGFSTLLDVWSVLLDVSPFLLDVWPLLLDVSGQGQKHKELQWFPARSLRALRFE